MSYFIVAILAVLGVQVLAKMFPAFDEWMKHPMALLSQAATAIAAWIMANGWSF